MECNIFEGGWVYDAAARPLYGEEDCPYIYDQLKCQAYGRPDTGYQHWRWQPSGCSLPRYKYSSNSAVVAITSAETFVINFVFIN